MLVSNSISYDVEEIELLDTLIKLGIMGYMGMQGTASEAFPGLRRIDLHVLARLQHWS